MALIAAGLDKTQILSRLRWQSDQIYTYARTAVLQVKDLTIAAVNGAYLSNDTPR